MSRNRRNPFRDQEQADHFADLLEYDFPPQGTCAADFDDERELLECRCSDPGCPCLGIKEAREL